MKLCSRCDSKSEKGAKGAKSVKIDEGLAKAGEGSEERKGSKQASKERKGRLK